METVGGIAGLLFFAKIIAHLYLLSKIEENFSLLSYSMYSIARRGQMLLPVFDDVPKKYRLLKTIINIVYAIAIASIIFFLIWTNTVKKHS
jgi:UDP-N-acetylmuramyl pentapeptide phosphotransferase/UDP-N-acetylglucosamine-1-phosphate transferase